jgi:acyl-CoA hydrolase
MILRQGKLNRKQGELKRGEASLSFRALKRDGVPLI